MTDVTMDLEFEIGGGIFGSHQGISGTVKAPVTAKLHTQFCSRHHGYGGALTCDACDSQIRNAIISYLENLGHPSIDCTALRHTHDCKCRNGHEYSVDCSQCNTGHPLERLAEASDDLLEPVMARIHALEQEVRLLRESAGEQA